MKRGAQADRALCCEGAGRTNAMGQTHGNVVGGVGQHDSKGPSKSVGEGQGGTRGKQTSSP